jgi:bifunctional ADP-heptose synthase (sugar kinase/adenylyltransferase)
VLGVLLTLANKALSYESPAALLGDVLGAGSSVLALLTSKGAKGGTAEEAQEAVERSP